MAVGGTVATDGVGGIMSARAMSEFVSDEGAGAVDESGAELVLAEISGADAEAVDVVSAVDAMGGAGGTGVSAGGVAETLTGAGAVAAGGGAEGGRETGRARG